MEESLQTLVSSQVHTEPLETSHHIPKKEFLRKRTKNFHNFYGDSYEGINDYKDHADFLRKPYNISKHKKPFKRAKMLKKKYKARNPVENNILKYFAMKKNQEILDYDELLEKGLIDDRPLSVDEPVNPHSLRNMNKMKKMKNRHNTSTVTSKIFRKKKEKKNNLHVNLLKIHMGNQKNSVNPVILEPHQNLVEAEEKKEDLNMNLNEIINQNAKKLKELNDLKEVKDFQDLKNLTKQENKNFEKKNTQNQENFDYEKLFFIPKFQKVMDQNYSNLSNTDKAYYQNLFYNRLMHFNNTFDYCNPYYNNSLFNMPDNMWNNMNNPMAHYQKSLISPLNNLNNHIIYEEELKIINKDDFERNRANLLLKTEHFSKNMIKEPKSNFFNFLDYSRINDRSLSTNEKLPNLLENYKLNNSLFDFPIIKKKVNYKKKETMKNWKCNQSSEKVIPFIGTNLENLLIHYHLNPFAVKSDDIIDYDGIFMNANKKIVVGHKRTKTFYKFNKNLKILNINQQIKEKPAKIKEKIEEKNEIEEEKKYKTTTIDNLYEKLNLDGLDIVENENVLIIDYNEDGNFVKKKEEKKDEKEVINQNFDKMSVEREKNKNLFGAYNTEQLKEYMFQKHKINVGKKFQAEIPKFNIFNKSDSDNTLAGFHEWKNNIVKEREFEDFQKNAIEKLGININEEEAANLISVYGYDVGKASVCLEKNLYYLREYLLGFFNFLHTNL